MTVGDASPVWHPFTQHALQPSSVEIVAAEGAWLTTGDGRLILDAISSWWVTTHGHRHPHIVAAIKAEADRLDQVIFAGFTHAPAERLARGLVAIAPPGLEHVFYSDSGSTSVEVALKMALGYWHNMGESRHRVLALEHGYHGDTIGGMSVGARGVFNAPYAPLLFEVTRLPFPAAGREQATLDALDAACREGGVAALIVEPLILGAGGMRIYSAAALAEMKRVCERHGVLLHRRRGHDGVGTYGHAVCLRAGRHLARHSVRREGDHRRGAAARRDAVHAANLRGALVLRPHQDVLPFELVHRQSARLRRGRRQPRGVGARAGGRPSGCPGRRPSAAPRRLRATTGASRTSAGSAPSQHSTSTCAMPAISPTLGRGSISSSWSAACCCARSATPSTSCRPYCIADIELDLVYDAIRAAADALA